MMRAGGYDGLRKLQVFFIIRFILLPEDYLINSGDET
jgi:hypothetical protein